MSAGVQLPALITLVIEEEGYKMPTDTPAARYRGFATVQELDAAVANGFPLASLSQAELADAILAEAQKKAEAVLRGLDYQNPDRE